MLIQIVGNPELYLFCSISLSDFQPEEFRSVKARYAVGFIGQLVSEWDIFWIVLDL